MADDQPTPDQPQLVAQAVHYTVAAGVAPGPDGQPTIQLQISLNNLVHFVANIPEEIADVLAGLLHDKLTAAAAELRRARLGLVLPGVAPVQLPPINGRHQ